MQRIFGRYSRMAMAVLIAFSMVTAPYGYPQHNVSSGLRRLLLDHEAYITNIDSEKFAGNGLGDFGETIDPDTGELSFRHTDIHLPGNSDFEIAYTRYISSDPDRPNFHGNASSTSSRGLGNWSSDFPYIVLPSINSNGIAGCISNSTEVDIDDAMYIAPRIRLGGKTYNLLKKPTTTNSAVFGVDHPDYASSSILKIEQTKSGKTCKWTATTTKGTVYTFGQVRVMAEKNGKKKHAVLITHVKDARGDSADYTYEGSQHRLKWVKASDGRTLEFVYNRAGTMIECVVANSGSETTKKRVWFYKFRTMSGTSLQYLYRAGINDTDFYWEFDELAGVHRHYGNAYARRCSFGRNARVRNPLGLVADYKTKRIINFVQAESPDGHKSTSHRAACIPPTDIYDHEFDLSGEFGDDDEYEYRQALKSPSLSDGTSIFGKFSTFFTSAVVERKITDIDQSVAIWTIAYGEDDLYNPVFNDSTDETVHKNQNAPVYVDITKPKTRTVTDPLGTKTVYKIGRSLDDTGLLVSVDVYAKNSTKAEYSAKYEYTHSKKPLGHAWNRERLNQTIAEKWTRVSKQTITIGGETYVTKSEFDAFGFPTKVTRSSTLQTDKIVERTTYTHNKSKWILGLVKTHSQNGRELSGASYDKNGRKVLETRFGSQFMRYSWFGNNMSAARNGGDETTRMHSYKRGISQNTKLQNGAVFKKVVDDNGWITQTTSPIGYVEKISYNPLGWQTKIDRMSGYADTTLSYTAPVFESIFGIAFISEGLTKKETTGSGKSRRVVTTKYNGRGSPILIETRDVTAKVSIYTRIRYDKLGREIFRSFPSFQSTATAGIETKYDAIGRETQKRENVAPFATETYSYLSNNGKRTTDAEGNSTTVYRSGFGSPDDGNEIKEIEANGRTTYRTYDKWQNLTEVRQVAGGKTRTRTLRYNSHNQLCFVSDPDTGTRAFEYDESRRVSRVELGVSETYVCKQPGKIYITKLDPNKVCTTQTMLVQIRGWPEPDFEVQEVTTCKYVYPTTKIEKASETETPKKPKTEPTTPPIVCLPNHYWNGKKCINPFTNPYYGETVEKGILYKHNSLGQVTSINYPSDNTPDLTKEYDLEGRVTKIVNGDVILTYTYGKRGELLTESLKISYTNDNNKKVTQTFKATYTYNQTGGRTSYFTPGGNMVKYILNAFNQSTSATINGLKVISDVKYHENGKIKSALLHNTNKSKNSESIKLLSTLNARQLPSNIQLNETGSIFSIATSYNKNKKVKSVTSSITFDNNEIEIGDRSYTYSSMNQVVSVSGDRQDITYTFDMFENMITKSIGRRTQTNVYHKTTGKLIESQYRKVTSNNSIEEERDDSISVDKKGRVEQLGQLTLKYNDSDSITSAVKTQNTIEVVNQKNLYDGNRSRVLSLTRYARKIDRGIPQYQNRQAFEFVSLGGSPIHRLIVEKNFTTTDNQYPNEAPGKIDIIRFGSDLALFFKDCIEWRYINSVNNLSVFLNADNSLKVGLSHDPFGSSMNATGGTRKGCEPPPKHVIDVPPMPPGFPDPWYPRFTEAASTSGSSSGNETTVNEIGVLRNAIRDFYTDIYSLTNGSFYSAQLGRYLVPNQSHLEKLAYHNLDNLYAFQRNDPVNNLVPMIKQSKSPQSISSLTFNTNSEIREYLRGIQMTSR